jgi:hypothetical protein
MDARVYRITVALVALLGVASGCSVDALRPVRSKYVITTSGGFLMTPEGGVVYAMGFELRQFINDPVYVVAQFENPENASSPLRTEIRVESRTLGFAVQSPRLRVLTHEKQYSIELAIYKDAAHTQLLGRHHQEIVFNVPPQLESQWESTYGIRIL